MKRFTALLIICALLLCGCQSNNGTFTPSKWREDPDNRTQIVDDLLERYELVGMTDNKVVSLLGKPGTDASYNPEDRYVYRLGNERGLFAIDSEWLVIDFENGVVVNYMLTTD